MIDLERTYPAPASCRRPDGSSRYAFMTFVMRNDSFIPGALVFAYALRRQQTGADLVCLVTREVTSPARAALELVFDRVLQVDEIYMPHKRRQERQDRPFLFTRFQALQSGADGNLGMRYEKIVLADADVLPLRCFDHLFSLQAPAGIINESKDNCLEYSPDGVYILPPSVAATGKWKWHQIYDNLCPHGSRIPEALTARVRTDPANLGVNSALWVLEPSAATLEAILTEAARDETHDLVVDAFNWPEMQFATLFWSGMWTSVDLRFCSFNGYPQLDVLCGTHFAGYKPWKTRDQGTFKRFSRFPDYALWQAHFLEMMTKIERLQSFPRLARLADVFRQGTTL
jgi:glycogenin glucosyltransferase